MDPGGCCGRFSGLRRAPGIATVVMLGSFSLPVLGVVASQMAWQLFGTVDVFEFARQFMR